MLEKVLEKNLENYNVDFTTLTLQVQRLEFMINDREYDIKRQKIENNHLLSKLYKIEKD